MSRSLDDILREKSTGLRNRKNSEASRAKLAEIFNEFQQETEFESKSSQEYEPLQFSSSLKEKASKPVVSEASKEVTSETSKEDSSKKQGTETTSVIEQMKDKLLSMISQGGKSVQEALSSTFVTLEKSTQDLMGTFSKQEREFINGVASQAAKHHVTQALISSLSISPHTAAILALGTMMWKATGASAQPVPGTDFAIFDGFPPDAQNLCDPTSLPSNNAQCNQFYVTYNQNTVVQQVSTLAQESGWDTGRIPYQALCVDSFKQCRDINAMKSAMSKILQNPNVTQFLNTGMPCTDTPITLDSRCTSNTVFKGLSGLGCNEMLGWDRNTSTSQFNRCLSAVRQNLTDAYAPCKPGDTSVECWSTGKQAGLVLGIAGGIATLFCLACACGTYSAAQWREENCWRHCRKR